MEFEDPIFVTQPSLPPLDEFVDSLQKIWESKWITNSGQFHKELESRLANYLGVPYVSLFSNGTLALVTAIQALGLTGEVITTPFSFVATTHALWWNKIKPVFADIDPVSGNIDPAKIEPLITERTSAILPVHVYGNPCNHDAIDQTAKKHGLKLIYDAAHAFAVKRNGQSILNYGDLSILSFHATKIFNTIEGGAVISGNVEMKQRIDRLKNFGFVDEVTVSEPGINAKMNELQAAYGLMQLDRIDSDIADCCRIAEYYRSELESVNGIECYLISDGVSWNYSYFPIKITSEFKASRDEVYDHLKMKNVFARKYFYPLISTFAPYSELSSSGVQKLPIAHAYADQILCLPIYSGLSIQHVKQIITLIKECA